MIAYVDASVLLRVVLRQPNALPEWAQIDRGVSSALVTTESLRTLDRLRLRAQLSDSELAPRRQAVLAVIASLELVEIEGTVAAAPNVDADVRWIGVSGVSIASSWVRNPNCTA
jgi:predicted nucleic acid-binding protein